MTSDETAFLRASWVNVLGNVAKIAVEGTLGLTFGSLALVADAAHSLGDLLASLVVLIWGRLSFRGPDSNHPHGHERVEPLTALFVGVTLVGLAVKIFYDAVTALVEGPQIRFSLLLVFGLAFAIADMILVYWYTDRVNQRLNSTGLNALAKDALNDIYTSFAAVLGIFGAGVGMPIVDPLAGGLVSLLVLKEGFGIARENVHYLTGGAPPQQEIESIRQTVLKHPSVHGVHDLRCHYVGTSIEVELHAEVDGDLTLGAAHDLETELRNRVLERPSVGDVHIHLDPGGMGEWQESA
ncbi:cation diffusion facilitator family transporter [Halodesulfurarchaeum formicicum]|uniref:Cation diffusion facilitator family transporter n=1 Tax=Halodesulfurarchaeum formicicum TaxID=1873524 RepID=A0A1D8S4N7_9EURY|nr:cation diffusion facilitator family transporter [Halodesulfurarchaeum formicicum]AOW80317.1 cation diffusion facilitator family transporter [Halodesulfurarchaeum formicicum]